MRHLLPILAALLLSAPAQAQTLKALMYNSTNGQVVANTGTNVLTFPFFFNFADGAGFASASHSGSVVEFDGELVNLTAENAIRVAAPNGIIFFDTNSSSATRANLGFSTNLNTLWTATNASNARSAISLGATWLTNTNVTNFRTAIGLGATDNAEFNSVNINELRWENVLIFEPETGTFMWPINFSTNNNALAITRNNLGLGGNNTVTFAGLTNNGDITINQTTATNGLLYIRRTNNEAFLGMANLIASNNTTVSNETLFRVGVAEATNRSAQFGFRSTNTNGNGVAVFSVFGFNALMQIGADASTNAVIFSGGGTNNEVMTLIRDGATEFARPLRFSTNAASKPATNAPDNTNNVAAWVEMRIGTNSYRVPLYQ